MNLRSILSREEEMETIINMNRMNYIQPSFKKIKNHLQKLINCVHRHSQYYPILIIYVLTFVFSLPVTSQNVSIIPEPLEFKQLKGDFHFNLNTRLSFDSPVIESLSGYLHTLIRSRTGIKIDLPAMKKKQMSNSIHLSLVEETWKGDQEGYHLAIYPKMIKITAGSNQGLFYGIQTLIQLIENSENGWLVSMEITDEPRFEWRGLMLDVSRHFFTIEEVKKLIDQMAEYKFNTLHLHLTDDQGWRIEIKSLPELTRIGAWRVPRYGLWWDRKPAHENETATMGGFYTQEQIRDLVNYASSRCIRILPEIDIPGHSLAAIAAYPWLSTTKLDYKVNPGSQFYTVDDNALSPIKEETYQFLDKVLSEVAELFPFEYIHIGGDECFKGFWENDFATQLFMKEQGINDVHELQSYFIKRVQKILHTKGKKMIGWDEILEGGLSPDATVMSWRGMQGGIIAAQSGHKVVMSPNSHAYLDLYQGDPAVEPPTYSILRLNTVYSFNPVPEQIDPALILGGQGNLWSESVPTFRHAEYMLWPRSLALSEALWSAPEKKNWDGFVMRTEKHLSLFKERNINFAPSMFDAIILPSMNDNGELTLQLETEISGLKCYYTFNNTLPDHTSPEYTPGEFLKPLPDADTFRVITYKNGKPLGRLITISLEALKGRTKQ